MFSSGVMDMLLKAEEDKKVEQSNMTMYLKVLGPHKYRMMTPQLLPTGVSLSPTSSSRLHSLPSWKRLYLLEAIFTGFDSVLAK
jgi:hypothetical protein